MDNDYQQFKNTVMEYYAEHARADLPWRVDTRPYYIVVSEIMLQQTQVERVIPFFKKWIGVFPNWKRLAGAPQSQVLRYWKGLGYNSRALRLQKLAQSITDTYHGRLPQDYKKLLDLPGIGPYTAGAVRAFAFDQYTPIIETNIRRVFIHHFFKGQAGVTDQQIREVMDDLGDIDNPREWYWALMDYGSQLPKIEKYNPNQQSKHYTRQSEFKGSDREIRGQILGVLLEQKNDRILKEKIFKKLGFEHERYQKIANQLEKEDFIKQTKKSLILR